MTQAISPTTLGIPLIPLEQAAAVMPFGDPANAVTLLMRLACRGSLSVMTAPGTNSRMVKTDDLTACLSGTSRAAQMREQMGLPPETLVPQFPLTDNWFNTRRVRGLLSILADRARPYVLSQAPAGETPASMAGLNSDQQWRLLMMQKVKTAADIPAQITPEIAAIFNAPAAHLDLTIFASQADQTAFSAFKNVGELALAAKLNALAEEQTKSATYQSFFAPYGSRNPPEGLSGFFSSASAYRSIVDAATEQLQSWSITVSKNYAILDRAGAPQWVPVYVIIPCKAVMDACGTTSARLEALAF